MIPGQRAPEDLERAPGRLLGGVEAVLVVVDASEIEPGRTDERMREPEGLLPDRERAFERGGGLRVRAPAVEVKSRLWREAATPSASGPSALSRIARARRRRSIAFASRPRSD